VQIAGKLRWFRAVSLFKIDMALEILPFERINLFDDHEGNYDVIMTKLLNAARIMNKHIGT
jgi:hypothetical protein